MFHTDQTKGSTVQYSNIYNMRVSVLWVCNMIHRLPQALRAPREIRVLKEREHLLWHHSHNYAADQTSKKPWGTTLNPWPCCKITFTKDFCHSKKWCYDIHSSTPISPIVKLNLKASALLYTQGLDQPCSQLLSTLRMERAFCTKWLSGH